MKKSDIKVGHTYVGKGGRRRKVVSLGGLVYSAQINQDTLNYIDVNAAVTAKPKNITRESFATWAVQEHPNAD